MLIEENRLILEEEISDFMLDELIKNINKKKVEIIEINIDNISSLALQQLFCISKEKKVVCNNSFVAKFFENIKFEE